MPEECRAPAGCELSVAEDGQAQLAARTNGQCEGGRARTGHVPLGERHDRDDVRGADARMGTLVAAKVDPLTRGRDAGEQGGHELVPVPDEREDGAVVIGVGVHVEELGVHAQGRGKRVDRGAVAPLREVRDGLEWQPHRRSLGSVRAYYDRRAPEYDEWYLGLGRFAGRERPAWHEHVAALEPLIRSLPPAHTLDVACGTAFLTRHLRGAVVGLDQSEAMLEIARSRAPGFEFIRGDALNLPFPDASFDRVFTSHFYGHLREGEREQFLSETRRVARELVVVDSALHDDVESEELQERILNDHSRWQVYKRYFTGEGLAAELGGAEVLHAGRWFVVARAAL